MTSDKETMARAAEKLGTARAIVRMKAPYLVPTIYGLVPHVVPDIGTMAVSKGMVLYYDDVWLLRCTDEEVAAALVHESMHIVRDHLARGEHMLEHGVANIAMDLAINPDIRDAGWTLPHGVFPADYGFDEGLTTEEYYALLLQPKPPQQGGGGSGKKQPQPPGPKQKGGGQGDQGASGGGKPENDGSQAKGAGGTGPTPPGASPNPAPGGGPGTAATGQGQGTGQQPGEGQQPAPGSGGSGKGNLPHGKSPGCGAGRCGGITGNREALEHALDETIGRSTADRKSIVKETIQEIKQHAAQKGRGSIPKAFQQEIDAKGIEKSKIRWQDELRHTLKRASGRIEAGGMDFSLARPSKRSPARGFPRPGLVQYTPEVAFILDTSGSMGTSEILEAIKQTVAIFRSLGIESAWLLQADAAVANTKRIRVRDLLSSLKILGRGGTHFDPALKAVEKLKPKPDLVVYLTDGDGYVTHCPKGIEVIWCIVSSHHHTDMGFGHTIHIGSDGKKVVREGKSI